MKRHELIFGVGLALVLVVSLTAACGAVRPPANESPSTQPAAVAELPTHMLAPPIVPSTITRPTLPPITHEPIPRATFMQITHLELFATSLCEGIFSYRRRST